MNEATVKLNERQPLLAEAFDVLWEHLGPQKTTQLWQVLIAPAGKNYLSFRHDLFMGKDVNTLYEEAKQFNRPNRDS